MDSLPLSPVCVWKIKCNLFPRNVLLDDFFPSRMITERLNFAYQWPFHPFSLLDSYFSGAIISSCQNQMSMRVWTITWPIRWYEGTACFLIMNVITKKKGGKASFPRQVTKLFPSLSNDPALSQGSSKVWSARSDLSLVTCIKWRHWTSLPWGED